MEEPEAEDPPGFEVETTAEKAWWAGFGFLGGFFLAAFLGTLILAVGLGSSSAATGGNADVVTLVVGERIYNTSCASCHGADGAGGIGLPLGNGAVIEKYPDINRQIRVIEEGRGAMPAFASTLTPAEIEAVAIYEREQLGR